MGGITDNSGWAAGTGPSDYSAPVGRPPYPGMIWDPKRHRWVWPNEPRGQESSSDPVTAALAALKNAR